MCIVCEDFVILYIQRYRHAHTASYLFQLPIATSYALPSITSSIPKKKKKIIKTLNNPKGIMGWQRTQRLFRTWLVNTNIFEFKTIALKHYEYVSSRKKSQFNGMICWPKAVTRSKQEWWIIVMSGHPLFFSFSLVCNELELVQLWRFRIGMLLILVHSLHVQQNHLILIQERSGAAHRCLFGAHNYTSFFSRNY